MIEKRLKNLKRIIRPNKKRKVNKFRDLNRALHEHKHPIPKNKSYSKKKSSRKKMKKKAGILGSAMKDLGVNIPAFARRKALKSLFSGKSGDIANRIRFLTSMAPSLYGWGSTYKDFLNAAKYQNAALAEPRGSSGIGTYDSSWSNPEHAMHQTQRVVY